MYQFGQIVGVILGLAIGALIGGFFVQLATRVVAGFQPTYRIACITSFLGALATLTIGFVFALLVGASGQKFSAFGIALITLIGFVINAVVTRALIKHPDFGTLGLGKALLIGVVHTVIFLLAALIVVLLVSAMVEHEDPQTQWHIIGALSALAGC